MIYERDKYEEKKERKERKYFLREKKRILLIFLMGSI